MIPLLAKRIVNRFSKKHFYTSLHGSTAGQKWTQPKCSLTDETIYTVEYYLSIQMKYPDMLLLRVG